MMSILLFTNVKSYDCNNLQFLIIKLVELDCVYRGIQAEIEY